MAVYPKQANFQQSDLKLSKVFMPLTALSPIDGRYAEKIAELRPQLSEFGLLHARTWVEIRWLQTLGSHPQILETKPFSQSEYRQLEEILEAFSLKDAIRIKSIEAEIRHDVKAVEYFLKEKLALRLELVPLQEFVHFGCTSEDINNLAWALILKNTRITSLLPVMNTLIEQLTTLAHQTATQPMLGRTHGQPAIPTTLGKEFANLVWRLRKQRTEFADIALWGKLNGAIGNYNAYAIAYPQIDWAAVSKQFVEGLRLQWLPFTTQIAPHDDIARYCDQLRQFNNILINFSSDIWGYIALGYFKQKIMPQEVGSSTMPHKINPIDFENAESNLTLANSLLQHFSNYLLQSRWQRDLRDSTLLRNLGVALAHSLLAWKNMIQGLANLEVDSEQLNQALDNHWEILAEAIQTVMRRHQQKFPYEQLKALTRGKNLSPETLRHFIQTLSLPEAVRQELLALTPQTYLGYAIALGEAI